MKWTLSVLILVFLIALVLFISFTKTPTSTAPSSSSALSLMPSFGASSSAVLGVQTKSSGCSVNGPSPDKDCTPGAVFVGVTKDQICQSGYSKSVRNVPESEKNAVYREYGVLSHQTGEYEVDHLISLELGGSNDISNLWPEAANPTPGFHEKDKVENYLHEQVCSGNISLEQAQSEIGNDWLSVYDTLK
jgi:hypothetical protein